MLYDVIIVGGGASALVACAALVQSGLNIILFEQSDRVGKKILATGSGRCNLSNRNMDASLYYEASGFVKKLYKTTSPEKLYRFFYELGLMIAVEDGRIYPRTFQSSTVLDVLRLACDHPNVTIKTNHLVTRIYKNTDNFIISTSNGEYKGKSCILAPGSNAGIKNPSNNPLLLAESLNIPYKQMTPALVQLCCKKKSLPSLKGIRVRARVGLYINHICTHEESGELLFTNYGVSGICVLQLSRHVFPALQENKLVYLKINFLPEIPQEEIEIWLTNRIKNHLGQPLANLFTGVLPRLVTQALLSELHLSSKQPVTSNLASLILPKLVSYSLPVTGTLCDKDAQIMRGGITLDSVNPFSMESIFHSNLYICGEILDCDGPCGGYNLHFAFTTGLTAAESIIERFAGSI